MAVRRKVPMLRTNPGHSAQLGVNNKYKRCIPIIKYKSKSFITHPTHTNVIAILPC
jgi:hypothetical protein